MKPLVTGLVIVLAVITIISGNVYWHHKINRAVAEAQTVLAHSPANHIAKNQSDTKKNSKTNKQDSTPSTNKDNGKQVDLQALTSNLPEDLQTAIIEKKKENQSFNLVLAGGQDITGLGDLLQKRLNEAYGASFFKITVANFKDSNSLDIYHNHMLTPYIKNKPDAILYTAVLQNDVGVVNVRDSLAVVRLLKNQVNAIDPNTLFLVEPPNPLLATPFFAGRVSDLKDDAGQNNYTYIDHWNAWPQQDSKLAHYLDKTGKLPNSKGNELWAQFLANYFTSKTE